MSVQPAAREEGSITNDESQVETLNERLWTCWTPGGFIGQMLKTIGVHVPLPANMPPPAQADEAPVVSGRRPPSIPTRAQSAPATYTSVTR